MKKFTKVVDDGEIYLLPDDKEAQKNTPSFMCEDEFPSIRVTDDDYNANTMIVELNKQLDEKERELKKATKSVISVDKSAVIAGSATLGIILSLVLILLFTLNNNVVSKTEHIVYEQPVVNIQDEQEENQSEYTEEVIYVQKEDTVNEDNQQNKGQVKQENSQISLEDFTYKIIKGMGTVIVPLFSVILVVICVRLAIHFWN